MRLYHVTSRRAAGGIVSEGFRDHVDADCGRAGVWFADQPFEYGVRAVQAVVVVDVPADILPEYEMPVGDVERWQEVTGEWEVVPDERYCAWHIPAAVVNQYPVVEVITD